MTSLVKSRTTFFQRFAMIFVIFIVPIAALFFYLYLHQVKAHRRQVNESLVQRVTAEKNQLQNRIRLILSDLQFLNSLDIVHLLIPEENRVDPVIKEEVADLFLRFSEAKGVYDQIRILDTEGRERVRVNYNNGSPSIVAQEDLQSKKGRYYFEDTLKLERGEVFVSPLDLNIERGAIEQPIKPMLRLGSPIYNNAGEKTGIVLLNYFGRHLLDAFGQLPPGEIEFHESLINREGYWFISPQSEDTWGFMYPEKSEITLSRRHPELWNRIQHEETGLYQKVSGDTFAFTSIYPLAATAIKSSTGSDQAYAPSAEEVKVDAYRWIAIAHYSAADFVSYRQSLAFRFFLFSLPLLVIAALVAGELALIITRRVAREEEADERMHSLQTLFDALPIGITLSHYEERKIISYNRAMQRLVGRMDEDLTGLAIEQYVDFKDEPFLPSLFDQQTFQAEGTVKKSDASEIPALVFRRNIFLNGEEFKLESYIDLTRLHDAEAKRLELERNLMQARKAVSMSDMAGGIAHNFNNILQVALSRIDMMLENNNFDSNTLQSLESLKVSCEKAAALSTKMLAYVGQRVLKLQSCSPCQTVQEVVEQWRENHERPVSLEIDNTIPEDLKIEYDPEQIAPALHHVIENAHEAYEDEEGQIRIRVYKEHITAAVDITRSEWDTSEFKAGDYVCIEIADDGAGMDAETSQRAIDPYFTTRFWGRGLGLSVVLGILRSHNGALQIESKPGAGTTVSLFLRCDFGIKKEA